MVAKTGKDSLQKANHPLNSRFRYLRKNISLYIMIAPVVIYFLIFSYWPMYGVIGAFQDYMPALGIFKSPWIGLENFQNFFSSFYFWRILRNTIGTSLYYVLVSIPAPIILALMFNEVKNFRLRSVLQTISYAPNFISSVVVCGMVLFFLRPDNGLINSVIGAIEGTNVNLIADPKAFWHIYVWSSLWQSVGWSSLIYTATIAGLDQSLYEAANLDGAGKFSQMLHVTIPGILPTIVIVNIMLIGSIMNTGDTINAGAEKILLLQNDLNLSYSEIISTYIYKKGLISADYGFSTAVGLFNNIINFVLLIAANYSAKRLGETSLW